MGRCHFGRLRSPPFSYGRCTSRLECWGELEYALFARSRYRTATESLMLFFKQGLIALFSGGAAWNSPSLKAILLSSYTYNATHQVVSDIAFNELTGYARPDVTASVVFNDSADRLELRFTDTTITAVADAQTVGAFAMFIEGEDDTDSDLIAYQTGVAEDTNGGAITLNAPPNSLGSDNFVFAVARGV